MRSHNYTVIRSGDVLKIGTDLVDATTGPLSAHGTLTVRRANIKTRYLSPKTLTWVSTADCVVSERILRNVAKREGQVVTELQSQGVRI